MLCKNFLYPMLLRYFEEISAIPRGSGHEEGMVAYLSRFAKERNLSFYTDEFKNVLIRLPASEGYECAPSILLQGHTDMVCEKNRGVEHNFLTDPLKLCVEDGWLRAKGTTLGADDGVAVAAMLALLDGASEAHPELECLFTSCEEAGMEGAVGFDYSLIHSRMMVNMDGCDDGVILAGCAGGLRSHINLPVEEEASEEPCVEIRVGGLAGGHSGEDIHRGRINAVKLLGEILAHLLVLYKDLRLISFWGGDKDNAIPREAEAKICLADRDGVKRILSELEKKLHENLVPEDEGLFLAVTDAPSVESVMDRASTERVIFLAAKIPNGVFAMNEDLKDQVSTSRNLGGMFADITGAKAIFLSRSDYDENIDYSAGELEFYASVLRGSCHHSYRFLGWNYAKESEIRSRYGEAYRAVTGNEARVETIHAGLECGHIKHAIPDMDVISVGPTVLNLHSPEETLNLDSFARFFEILLETLKYH
ncbi:MAG: beta-Ala-His dipeptidase [Clostridia bacterium]|nr:beta-Ala-His dipeptidase [Clostridia bacterium]